MIALVSAKLFGNALGRHHLLQRHQLQGAPIVDLPCRGRHLAQLHFLAPECADRLEPGLALGALGRAAVVSPVERFVIEFTLDLLQPFLCCLPTGRCVIQLQGDRCLLGAGLAVLLWEGAIDVEPPPLDPDLRHTMSAQNCMDLSRAG